MRMKQGGPLRLIVMTLTAVCVGSLSAEVKPIPDQLPDDFKAQILQLLPADWRAPVEQNHLLEDYSFRYAYANDSPRNFFTFYTPAEVEYTVLKAMTNLPGMQTFVLAHLRALPPDSRRYLYLWIGLDPKELWINDKGLDAALEQAATAETDERCAAAAKQALRMLDAHRHKNALEIRLQDSRFTSYPADRVANEGERESLLRELRPLYLAMDGVTLPQSAIDPPAVFTVPVKSAAVRVAVIGDYGTMDESHPNQKKVADAMVAYSKSHRFDFGLTVGDNFYFRMKSPQDDLWRVDFEDLYGPMGITFYPAFGNHDWDDAMASIEILRSHESKHWQFPAQYYTYVAGPVQFFVINTGLDENTSLNAAQMDWLKSALLESKATWKIVYGHYPVKDTQTGYDWGVYNRLIPVLAGRADAYICGHMHEAAHMKPEAGVNLFIAGASGQAYAGHDFDSMVNFVSGENGFAVLEADAHDLTMHWINGDGKELYQTTLKK